MYSGVRTLEMIQCENNMHIFCDDFGMVYGLHYQGTWYLVFIFDTYNRVVRVFLDHGVHDFLRILFALYTMNASWYQVYICITPPTQNMHVMCYINTNNRYTKHLYYYIPPVTVYRLPIRLPAKSALTWPVV